jgi:ABC-type uncharacterized transport system substrate-binding protein
VDLANGIAYLLYPFRAMSKTADWSATASDADLFRRAAGYVDRILKGAKPAELPVEQPSNLKCVNLNAARALGVTVPELFLRAPIRVIE